MTCFLFWLFLFGFIATPHLRACADYGRSRFATSLVSLANVVVRFKLGRGSQEKRPFSNGLFSIQSEGLACNLTAGEYVIAEGVWHHASACILLRIDYIQHFVLIPYRRQAADFIHGFAVILRVAILYYEPQKSVHASVRIFYFFTFNSSLFTNSACTDFLESNR